MSHPYALPLEQNPPVQSYQHHAFWLSMILGNEPAARPWLTMQYTNLMWDTRDGLLNPYIYSDWRFETEQLLPTKFLVNVPPAMVRGYRTFDLVALIREMLDHGYYQMGTFDEFYVPAKLGYQKRHFVHNNLLYGYDDEKGCFLSIGYTRNRLYEPFAVSYTDYVESVYRLKQRVIGALFCYYQPNPACRFQPGTYRAVLSDYISAANKGETRNIYGIECLGVIAAALRERSEGPFDLRPLRVIREHANLTYEGLTHLEASGAGIDPARYRPVVAAAETALNLGIKLRLTGRETLAREAASALEEMGRIEKELLAPICGPER